MRTIRTLTEQIDDELQDAGKYARLALEYKTTDPEMASLFYRLSCEELTHMTMLHDCVASKIEAHQKNGLEIPESMQALYDYLHKRQIERTETVKRLQQMFRG